MARQPDQRDALLGLAGLALHEADLATAHRLYRQVLRRKPDDPTALAALVSIEGGSGEETSESRLKMLLDQGVDAGYVYFSLGNLYARNRRWADAQQAYFEALRYHPNNADYNYNLAVSLDRIGQRAAALSYYEAALKYGAGQRAGFDPATVGARIQSLAGAAP